MFQLFRNIVFIFYANAFLNKSSTNIDSLQIEQSYLLLYFFKNHNTYYRKNIAVSVFSNIVQPYFLFFRKMYAVRIAD